MTTARTAMKKKKKKKRNKKRKKHPLGLFGVRIQPAMVHWWCGTSRSSTALNKVVADRKRVVVPVVE